VIVMRIFGWKAQRTSTVPAVFNAIVADCPGSCAFELNSLPFEV
jgi:hypothetical protein